MAGRLRIEVEAITGQVESLELPRSSTLADLKYEIWQRLRVAPQHQALIYCSRALKADENWRRLDDMGLRSPAKIQLLLLARAGPLETESAQQNVDAVAEQRRSAMCDRNSNHTKGSFRRSFYFTSESETGPSHSYSHLNSDGQHDQSPPLKTCQDAGADTFSRLCVDAKKRAEDNWRTMQRMRELKKCIEKSKVDKKHSLNGPIQSSQTRPELYVTQPCSQSGTSRAMHLASAPEDTSAKESSAGRAHLQRELTCTESSSRPTNFLYAGETEVEDFRSETGYFSPRPISSGSSHPHHQHQARSHALSCASGPPVAHAPNYHHRPQTANTQRHVGCRAAASSSAAVHGLQQTLHVHNTPAAGFNSTADAQQSSRLAPLKVRSSSSEWEPDNDGRLLGGQKGRMKGDGDDSDLCESGGVGLSMYMQHSPQLRPSIIGHYQDNEGSDPSELSSGGVVIASGAVDSVPNCRKIRTRKRTVNRGGLTPNVTGGAGHAAHSAAVGCGAAASWQPIPQQAASGSSARPPRCRQTGTVPPAAASNTVQSVPTGQMHALASKTQQMQIATADATSSDEDDSSFVGAATPPSSAVSPLSSAVNPLKFQTKNRANSLGTQCMASQSIGRKSTGTMVRHTRHRGHSTSAADGTSDSQAECAAQFALGAQVATGAAASSQVSGVPPNAATVPAGSQQPRCAVCGVRGGGANAFLCKCGKALCGRHRHPDAHTCQFDLGPAGVSASGGASAGLSVPGAGSRPPAATGGAALHRRSMARVDTASD